MKASYTQLLCDPMVTNRKETTAILTVGSPENKTHILDFDKPWEGDYCIYQNFFFDEDRYRLYYLAHKTGNPIQEIRVCYMESIDGENWIRPNLGLREFNGNKNNNIILDKKTDKPNGDDFFDNFFVFKDENPKCKKEEKYKAMVYRHEYQLEYFYSEDAINFHLGNKLSIQGHFDTLNVCFFDTNINKYVAFIRGFHGIPESGDTNKGIRDIRITYSEDFINWSEPKLLSFNNNAEDYPLYTNNVIKYPTNPSLYIGFPTRYMERPGWSDNYEALTGKEARLERMKEHPRLGLAITDCVFMLSQNMETWERFDDAFITPGIENPTNWVYGDSYPSYGLIDDGDFYKMFIYGKQWSDGPADFSSFKVRKDGFAYYKAPYSGGIVETNYFEFTGGELSINFSTSARGYVFVSMIDENGTVTKSCELFGDSTNRNVKLDSDSFEGKKVKLLFEMKDAKLYSYKFINK